MCAKSFDHALITLNLIREHGNSCLQIYFSTWQEAHAHGRSRIIPARHWMGDFAAIDSYGVVRRGKDMAMFDEHYEV